MTLVQQADQKGCGLACVAMVTGKPYALVRKRARLAQNWRPSYGMNGAMLQRQLDAFHRTVLGVTYRYAAPRSKLAIVKINADVPHETRRDANRRMQHWVVWHDGRVYDPGPGIEWYDPLKDVDGIELYLASVGPTARTGLWYWV